MSRYRACLIIFRIAIALLIVGAVVNEIATLMMRGRFAPLNFFSFFTIQSNLYAAAMLGVGAILLAARRDSPLLDGLRGAATLYMALTGVVFSILLSGLDPAVLTARPTDNLILHYVAPIALVLDWLLDRAGQISIRSVLLWLIYPVLYLAYTLIRGPIVHWYPYPFLDPAERGYGPVALVCAVITLGVVGAGFIVRWRSLRVPWSASR